MPYKFNPISGQLDFYTKPTGELVGEKYVRTTRFKIISSGTSGTIILPANSTVVLDDFGGTVDAIVAQVSGGKPLLAPAVDVSEEVIATTFNGSGDWVLSGTPVSYPIAILYRVRQKLIEFDSDATDIWGNSTTVESSGAVTSPETSPVFTYSTGKLQRIDYASTTYKEFFYDGSDRLIRVDTHPSGLSTIIRKTFNYSGDTLLSITQTIV